MKDQIESALKELIPTEGDVLFEAAHYALEGGKRLRPLLLLAVVETFEVPKEIALYPACALEMIHTYSLIHDDLPCMDDDDFRREKPTLHKAYPESHAVLTGDFLLTYAFEVLTKTPEISDAQKNTLVRILSNRSGSRGIIGGQVLDIENNCDHLESVREMQLKKTGALFIAALEMGGVIAGQDLEPLQAIGTHLGIAFQMMDDFQDEDGAVFFLGKDQTHKMAESHFEKASKIIQTLPNGGPKLKSLANDMIFC